MIETKVVLHEQLPLNSSADAFRGFEKVFRGERMKIAESLKREVAEAKREQVKEMITGQITDVAWNELINAARKTAEHGEKQYLLLRFPSSLCTDESRAINNPPNPTWPQTLRGEAADIYNRWHTALRPLGFNLSAQVLDFPDGKPGDVGLFLIWGE